MSILKKPIDYDSLENELHQALKADELYRLQNDAKIRAVEQRVPTYEDFKEMVNGAHLKPLERADVKRTSGISWNASVTKDSQAEGHRYNRASEKLTILQSRELNFFPNTIPKTTDEFLQTWNKITDRAAKLAYLTTARSKLQEIYVDIPPKIFGEIIDTCSKNISNVDNVNVIIDILTILSNCNRFHLSLIFMTTEEKENCRQLFQILLNEAKTYGEGLDIRVNALWKKYNHF